MKNFLAFDLGASSGRAIIGTLNGNKLELKEVHRFSNAPVQHDGAISWDYPRLCQELVNGLGKALEHTKQLDGIAIDTWGVDYVIFDADKQAVRWPYNYRDPRTEKSTVKLWAKVPADEIYRATGIQKMNFNTIYQLCAHMDEHPEDLTAGHVFLHIPDALEFALGGDFNTEYTIASTSSLLDPATKNWNWELIDRCGLPRSIFPEIAAPASCGGVLKAELQEKFGCGPIPIWKVGSHDTASAVAAVPAPESGNWAYLSAGTWALLGAELNEPSITEAGQSAGFTNEGGLDGKIRFLTNIMGSWLFQETRRVWNEAGQNLGFAEISQLASKEELGKYLFNPNHDSLLTPGDMPGRVRKLCQNPDMTDGEVARAIYDSLACYFVHKLHLLEDLLNIKYSAFNVVGGGTQDRLLMQLTADAMNIPVIAGPIEATATGNILAQAIACGALPDLEAARAVVRNSFEVITYTPNADNHAKYEQLAARFLDLLK